MSATANPHSTDRFRDVSATSFSRSNVLIFGRLILYLFNYNIYNKNISVRLSNPAYK